MALPSLLQGKLTLPAISAPMFLTSGPQLVINTCRNGVVGAFPALNQRTSAGFEEWLVEIEAELDRASQQDPAASIAPFAVNLIVHPTNKRLEADLDICVKRKVPIVITSLGSNPHVVAKIHAYGGIVFHDVTNVRHARKAASAGVDGLILVCAGGGGHASAISPFALLADVRREFAGTIILAGALSTGADIAAARIMGADLTYLGTRFLATKESMVAEEYKQMVLNSRAEDIVYTANLSGVPANFLGKSIEDAGLDLSTIATPEFDSQKELAATDREVWKTIWSAGQGCAAIEDIPSIASLIKNLKSEYEQTLSAAEAMLAETRF